MQKEEKENINEKIYKFGDRERKGDANKKILEIFGEILSEDENNVLTVNDETKIKNVYLDLDQGYIKYDATNGVKDFYTTHNSFLEELIEENDIVLNDFVIHIALNNAILDFIKKDGKNISSAEDKEKLKEYFFSNLVYMFEKSKKYSILTALDEQNNGKSTMYFYKNYFFKIENSFADYRFMANEYAVYNRIKENKKLKGNINKYYGCFDKEFDKFDNRKYRFIVSKRLDIDDYLNLSQKRDRKYYTKKQYEDIIKKVLDLHTELEKEGLYNYDLKPENVMMNDKGDIKLIDYEGMVPKDSTNLLATVALHYVEIFIADETLRSAYYDFIKFAFMLNLLSKVQDKDEFLSDCSQLYVDINTVIKNVKVYYQNGDMGGTDKVVVESEAQFISSLKTFRTKHAHYFKGLGFDEKRLRNVEEIVNADKTLINKKNYKNITTKELTEINAKTLSGKKENIIHIPNGLMINESNKLVRNNNRKLLIEKRNKGDYFYPINWYYNLKNKSIKTGGLSDFFKYIQDNGTVLQEIVDDLIPIDETNIFQQIVLGTLMENFLMENIIDANSKNNKEYDEEDEEQYLKELYEKLQNNNVVNKYFGKDAFKKVFMQIIEADKTLLDSFFDFNNECEIRQDEKDMNKFKLQFKSSKLKLDLNEQEFDKIVNKFKVPVIKEDKYSKKEEKEWII